MLIGIDAVAFYTSRYFIDLGLLAQVRGVDPAKFYVGIGQEKMSVPPPNEDIVTMGTNATRKVLKQITDPHNIKLLLFATESGIDQSKAAGIYVHHFTGLSSNCRVIELKQACYSATAALQMAVAIVQRNPEQKALIVASDIARYGLNTPGEPTQGCGAVAMVISASPRLVAIEPYSGVHTEHVMDFWRPNYKNEAIVNGKYSAQVYMNALKAAWQEFSNNSGFSNTDIELFCYHTPFCRMAEKAHFQFANFEPMRKSVENCCRDVASSLIYSRLIGNSYTAALYISLASLLENDRRNLSGKRIGFFGYGSGCVGEYFSGIIQPEYKKALIKNYHKELLNSRIPLSYKEYERFYLSHANDSAKFQTGCLEFVGVSDDHKRIYQAA